jgi:hypothetical protein
MSTFDYWVMQDEKVDIESTEYNLLVSRIRETAIKNGDKGLTVAGTIAHLKNNRTVKHLLNIVTVLRAFVELDEEEDFTIVEGKTLKLFPAHLVQST